MSQALYRKYRSKSLGEIVGQGHVTDILQRSLAAGRIAHAYLLTGPRGVGKTSIARILAHEINQLPYTDDTTHLDIIEIDAASNNGVEDVRELREKVQIAPISAKKKIYIIDEVHMLSKAAFNALLKTLEEPPEHVVFILATTDVEKLPATIISRTQRFHFRTITPDDAVKHLAHIAKEEGIKIEDEALRLIALRGEGSFRDSISLLDQLRSLTDEKEDITVALVEKSLGLAPAKLIDDILAAYDSKDLEKLITLLDESEASGVQASMLAGQLIQAVRGRIASAPQLLLLLDQLLEVGKSSQPSIKLLTVLATPIHPKPKTAALTAPPLEVSASVEELKKPLPHEQSVPRAVKKTETKVASAPKKETPAQTPGAVLAASGEIHLDAFDWGKIIAYTREHFVAIYSVLSKCGHELDGETLVLYTGNAFYKKKLDDSKYRVDLSKSLEETGVGNLAIETVPTPPPPKDSVAAAVAAIMGGGEEVTVDAAADGK